MNAVHTRRLPVRACDARRALDTLGTARDQVWPQDDWRFISDGDSTAAQSPTHQVIAGCERSLELRVQGPGLVRGTHRFELRPDRLACEVRHTVRLDRPSLGARLWWLAAGRPLYRALIEDVFDNLTRVAGAEVRQPARASRYVRLLRGSRHLRWVSVRLTAGSAPRPTARRSLRKDYAPAWSSSV